MKVLKIKFISGLLSALCSIFPLFCFAQTTPDPGIPGSYAVSTMEYDLGNTIYTTPTFPFPLEVRGSVHYPTTLSAGPFPVLMFLHGRHETTFQTSNPSNSNGDWPPAAGYESITSFRGYNYLAEQMASHGYIVISISANAINADDNSLADRGMPARADLTQHHLDLWNTWNTTGGVPFGSMFVGTLDLSRVGTMGHSRGGEGVVKHALLNESLGSPYGVKAVLALAPVDFGRAVLNDIPLMNIAPYCDGDVDDLQGVHFYDDARYSDLTDETEKYSILMMGTNHNFYNTVWTPGLYPAGTADDWDEYFGSTAPHCGSAAASSKRLSPSEQQATLISYASAFFRVHVGNENVFRPILEVDDRIPPVSSGVDSTQIFVSYHPPASERLDINRIQTEASELTNTAGGAVSQNGLVKFDVCADDPAEIDCDVSVFHAKEPHSGSGSTLGAPQMGMRWDNVTDWYQNALPVAYQNLTVYDAIQFRVGMDYSESTSGQALDFTVQLIDGSGGTSNQLVGDHTNVLYWPPGTEGGELPKMMLNTVKIPLTSYTGIDMTQVQYIKFLYNVAAPAVGSIYITDLALTGYTPVATSVSINSSLNTVLIYPNPASNTVNVDLGNDFGKINRVVLCDIQGKIVYENTQIRNKMISIDLEKFSRGIYVLDIFSGNDSKKFKLVKQ